MRIPILFAFVALLLLPVAAAQVPATPSPSLTLTISGAPAQVPALASNGTANVGFNLDVALSGALCPQGGTIPITLTVTPKGSAGFFSVAADAAEVAATIAQPGAHLVTPFTASVPASFTATTKEITANASIPIEIAASAAWPTGCQPSGPAATAAPVTVFANLTAPPPPPMPEPTPEDKGFLPGFSAVHGTLAAIVAVVLLRRRS